MSAINPLIMPATNAERIYPAPIKISWFIGCLCLLYSIFIQAANLTSSVDRNSISENETLILQLRYDDRAATDQVDWSALRQDFEILSLRPQSSSNIRIINGKQSREVSTVWSLVLAPKREGTLLIPSFKLGSAVSDAIRIKVRDSQSIPASEKPMQVNVNIMPSEVRVGQQAIVEIELIARTGVGNLSGEQLEIHGVEVQLLDQQSFSRIENGLSWQVVKWSYAVFPTQSGTLKLPPQMFSGTITDRSQRNFFDPFSNRGQRIAARSDSSKIAVLEPSLIAGQSWFPAENVRIKAEWATTGSGFRVGEPVTRTISITAVGQLASVIPPLKQYASEEYKSYNDQPQLDNAMSSSGVIGVRKESEAIVPAKAGKLTLPEQRISWWSSESQKWEVAVLPKETIDVLPANNEDSFTPPDTQTTVQATQDLPLEQKDTPAANQSDNWMWVSIVLGMINLILLLWVIRLGSKRYAERQDRKPNTNDQSEKAAWKAMNNAAKQNKLAPFRKCLIEWIYVCWKDRSVRTIQELSQTVSSQELQILLQQMEKSLFSGSNSNTPDLKKICNYLEPFRQGGTQHIQQEQPLPSLYPKPDQNPA